MLSHRDGEDVTAERGIDVSYNVFNLPRHLIARHPLRTVRAQGVTDWQVAAAAA
ncbi:MAG TPA: hypothetical protein VD978_24335 [Azospirillum sp.]|nr:hypothetical protein [Azospirillum sp.]